MPLLHATHLITTLEADGAQIGLMRILRQLGGRGAAMDVVSLGPDGPVGEMLRALDVRVRSLDMRGWRHAPGALARLAGTLRRERPGLLVTWLYHANVLGSLAAKLAGGPPVVWNIAHSTFEPHHAKWHTRMAVRLGARLAARGPRQVVFCSAASRAVHCGNGYPPERSVFVPNGFDLQQFRPSAADRAEVRRELQLPDQALLVGTIGRFHPDKDHANFAEAAGRIARRCPDACFVLCGRGVSADNPSLVRMLEAAAVLSRCRLLGARGDIPRVMAALDAYVSSSSTEAFPNVLGEAMSCGVPCVATDCGDSRYIVAETGRVVPPRDPERLADACLSVLDLPAEGRLRLGAAARARIAHEFDLRHTAERHYAHWQAAAGVTVEQPSPRTATLARAGDRAA